MNLDTRKKEMKQLRKQGFSLQQIGNKYQLSRERIRQIVNDIKLPKAERKWFIASQSSRITCYICRTKLERPSKFCRQCVKENKLSSGGRELPRGVVRGRDNNTCQVCGYKWKGTEKKRLDVHHLGGLCGERTQMYDTPEMLYHMITVCHRCHYNLHDHRKNGIKSYEARTTTK